MKRGKQYLRGAIDGKASIEEKVKEGPFEVDLGRVHKTKLNEEKAAIVANDTTALAGGPREGSNDEMEEHGKPDEETNPDEVPEIHVEVVPLSVQLLGAFWIEEKLAFAESISIEGHLETGESEKRLDRIQNL